MSCSFATRLFACAALAGLPAAAQVRITQGDGQIAVEIGGKPFTTLYAGKGEAKPYLHPLRSASGKIVTRSYPMANVPGEARDHPHHRGLWFSHGNVNGYDFWGNDPSQEGPKTGHIKLAKVVALKSGAKSGSIACIFNWLDPHGKALLSESRNMVFYSDPALRTIDFDIDLTALDQVKFGDTKEGTFALRLAAPLEEPDTERTGPPKPTGIMINAQGAKGEKNVWGSRSEWVDYSGEIDGEKLGIAILDHPDNPRHPTYWHSRAYGLFAANPFGVHDFERDKTKDGSLTLKAGEHLRFRYRVIIHPGNLDSANIAARYAEYAHK